MRRRALLATAAGGALLGLIGYLEQSGGAAAIPIAPAPPTVLSEHAAATPRLSRPTVSDEALVSMPVSRRDERRTAVTDARVRRAVGGLAGVLTLPGFERPGWTRTARAVADSLGENAVPILVRMLDEEGRSTAEVIAAGELLGRLGPKPDHASPLPGEALARLRGTAADLEAGALAVAAARVLCSAGDARDAEAIVERLFAEPDTPDGTDADVAAWALAANRRASVARAIAERLETAAADRRLVLCLRALGDMARAGVDEITLARVRESAALRLLDPETPDDVSTGIVAALGRLDPEHARDVLIECLDGGRPELARSSLQQLAASGDDEALYALGDRLVAATDESERASIAEGLMLAWGNERLPSHVRATMVETLETAALFSPEAARRRRAVHCLGATLQPGRADSLTRVLTQDPDARVRGAAADALGRLPDADQHVELLRYVGESDPSGVVRRTAGNQLRRLGVVVPPESSAETVED